MTKVFREFTEFLKEYKIVSLAVAFVMGSASTALVNSLVKDVVMPFISPIMGGAAWRTAMLNLGPVHIAYGNFLAEAINFLILAAVVFVVVRKLFKAEQQVDKAKAKEAEKKAEAKAEEKKEEAKKDEKKS